MTNKITEQEEWIYELRCEIKRKNLMIANMYQTPLVTDDMIAEALDDKIQPDDHASIEVIFNSWGGKTNMRSDAVEQFIKILETIKGYE